MASVRRCEKLPPCLLVPMPAGSKTEPAVIPGLAGLVNARQKTCLDSGAKSRRVNKGSN